MIQRMSKLNPMIVGLATLLIAAAPLLAQVPAKPGPPPQANPWPAWIIAIVCIAGVCVAAFKSAKRTHQD